MIHLCLLLAVTWGEEIGSGKEFWNVETTYPVLYVVTVCLIGPFVEYQPIQSMSYSCFPLALSSAGHITGQAQFG